ncbi:MAG TPA: hypothetical protein VE860_15110 [Chthoniobacterales bacterium]|nr:hypothetical protein [Chthoniobacterales bacterium]
MSELEYYADEIADSDLDAIADAGEFYLDESGFYEMPSSDEIEQMAKMGETLLLREWLGLL